MDSSREPREETTAVTRLDKQHTNCCNEKGLEQIQSMEKGNCRYAMHDKIRYMKIDKLTLELLIISLIISREPQI